MIYLQGAMRRRVNWIVAALIIIIIAASAAWMITAKAIAPGFFFGGKVISTIPICTIPIGGNCGCLVCGCGPWTEIIVKPGDTLSAPYLCPNPGITILGAGIVKPGMYVLGLGASPYAIFYLGSAK